jgi:hypothetical protein
MRNNMRNQEEEKNDRTEEEKAFERLYEEVYNLLLRFGRPNFRLERPHADFTVHGDFGGYPQVVVFVTNLEMLRPSVIKALQQLVKNYPAWEIEVAVALREHRQDWPHMGLYVRPHEVIDGLQRRYFPEEFRDIEYTELEGVRRGTAYD